MCIFFNNHCSAGESSGKDLEVFLSGTTSSTIGSLSTCNMCQNYEAGLQKAQQKVKELEKALELSEKNLQRGKDDLAREHAFRQEMEVKWNEKKEQHKIQVTPFDTHGLFLDLHEHLYHIYHSIMVETFQIPLFQIVFLPIRLMHPALYFIADNRVAEETWGS